MKRLLLSLLDRLRAELNDAAAAIENDDVEGAVSKLYSVVDLIREATPPRDDETGRRAA